MNNETKQDEQQQTNGNVKVFGVSGTYKGRRIGTEEELWLAFDNDKRTCIITDEHGEPLDTTEHSADGFEALELIEAV